MKRSARELAIGCVVVAVVAALGAAMAFQGWRSRIPNYDTIPSIAGAHQFLETRRPPDRGVLNSYLSYVPPGATWLFVPGAAIFPDPRLAEFPGAAFLSIGTLVGILLLARRHFGLPSALVAVVLYGLSQIGVNFAASVGPRGHPFFFVWMVYFACEWARDGRDGLSRAPGRRDPGRAARCLAAAVGFWAAGMYLFLELAPAVLMLPILWLRFRPSVKVRPLMVVAAIVLVAWFPYLRFEWSRGFVDLTSQFLLRTVSSAPVLQCDQSLSFRQIGDAPPDRPIGTATTSPGRRLALSAGRRALAIASGALANLESPVPGVDVALLAVILCAFAILWRTSAESGARQVSGRLWLSVVAAGLILAALLAGDTVARWLLPPGTAITAFAGESIRSARVLLAIAGVALLARRRLASGLDRLRQGMGPLAADPRALLVCLAVPWLTCLLVVEHGRLNRLSFLWPVQAVVLAAGLMRIVVPNRRLGPLAAALAVAALAVEPAVFFAAGMREAGWSGAEAEEIGITRDLAAAIHSSNRTQAAIGYQLYVSATWGSRFVLSDPRDKIGADFDLLLAYPHRVSNVSRCAEGVSQGDEYRVVELHPSEDGPFDYVDVPPDASFHLVRTYGSYALYRRQ